MQEILPDIRRWKARGERYALATVIATRRSAPRPVGSKLAVSETGEMAGSVSGGCVENEVYGCAREILDGARPQLLTYGISDDLALSVGLPCGGEIDVFLNLVDDKVVDQVKDISTAGTRAVVLTSLDGSGASTIVVEGQRADVDDLIRGRRNLIVDQEGDRVFVEVLGPPPRLLVFGAVDTAEALCAAAKLVGWRTVVADARSRFATRERIPSADELVVGWPDVVMAQIQPDHDTAVVVLTHDDRFDIPALVGGLATDAFYIAALGSRRNQERRRELLREAGVGEDELDRVAGPAGLDIGANSPAETALSILAEAMARRAGRAGGPLKDSTDRIHSARTP